MNVNFVSKLSDERLFSEITLTKKQWSFEQIARDIDATIYMH